jgi:hypothetical protein
MRKTIRASLALTLVCALVACSSSKLNRVIASVEVAATIPSFPAQVREGFSETARALRTVRDNPNAATWQNALRIFDDLNARNVFRVSDPNLQATISAIVAVVRVLLEDAAPQISGDGARANPDVGKLKEADVKELERLVREARK